MYVFVFSFACAFLLAGRGPVLAISTRVMLVIVIAFAGGYGLLGGSRYQSLLGAATVVANVLFVLFGAIDFMRYRSQRSERS